MSGTLYIASRSYEPFKDREEAGSVLGRELEKFCGRDVVVLGIPRGGIIVAAKVSKILGAELDIILCRKLGAPYNPELAIGAVSESGNVFLNENIIVQLGVKESYIAAEKARQSEELTRRIKLYRKARPKVKLEGRAAIVTDDGVATGASMQAVLWAVHQEKPKSIIAALPVGPEDTLERLTEDADKVVCLKVPDFFSAVGQFYRNFSQVEDEEVLKILAEE